MKSEEIKKMPHYLNIELDIILNEYTKKLTDIPESFILIITKTFEESKALTDKVFLNVTKHENLGFVIDQKLLNQFIELHLAKLSLEIKSLNYEVGNLFLKQHLKNVERFKNGLKGTSLFYNGMIKVEDFAKEIADTMLLSTKNFTQALINYYSKNILAD